LLIKKVGIPRGLFYYKYFPLWKTFMEELGAEIVVSDYTSKKILDVGVKTCIDETCLPVKVYHGHIASLKDKVDYLFVPRFTSISKNEYVCPKFGGLPDMVRHSFKDLPVIIDTEVNLRKSNRNAMKAALEVGSYFSDNKRKVKEAFLKATVKYKEFRVNLEKGIIPSDIWVKGRGNLNKTIENPLNILIIGHVYNLYDNYINMDMAHKLLNAGVNIITVDMIKEKIINERVGILNKRLFWNFGRQAMGSALYALENEVVDGIIYIMSFGCGVDSFMSDLVERKVREGKNIPFMVLTLDEHSGEAGMDTRLEAFIDMIRWRA
jgi:predicted nucleotide-binding protein (sugar kinase/HSP70/actin superfamily)